ncbi:AsmA family protein [Chitinophaga sancti]|uniref:AsmA protein n=1 Tax=Chitinophaga sancti TaxID=1004 RepID=A0A1K1SQT3_9BACT|nr:AsmA-like C-terminal region-containing protein [Chitinophaga sancti]WQD61066.1 AsmA-like C-terminal region-containing protein [Chitinophaga sancti]WQG86805.1 AsmA-like C-terminal region-containing protein [Chitinophaga sancti]SFW86658.1 AsmA protein [Chitinophaga sancti]
MSFVQFKRTALRTLKIASITIVSILLLLFLLPVLFPTTISNKIKTWTNNTITGDLNFSKARLSFFNHFPSLTLTLYDFSLKGAAPFQQDTLIAANEVALGVNLASVFSSAVKIDEIYLTKGNIHIMVDSAGHPNYNVYQSAPATNPAKTDSGSASLKIARIQLEHCNIIYNDQSLPLYVKAQDVDYLGKGDLSKAQFDLYSHLQASSFDLSYGNTPYIQNKKLDGELITKVNTNSLDLVFEKNDLKINELPVQFKGKFGFLKNGYTMDFKLRSKESSLAAIFTALPHEYTTWLDHTHIEGAADVNASLIGEYIAETNTMPDLTFNVQIRNGMIANTKAPAPVKNLFLNFQSQLRHLNTDSLTVNIDSIFFNIDKDYFSAIMKLKGLTTPELHVKLNTDIDLEKWSKAVGLQSFEMKGRFQAHLLADGKYAKSVIYRGLRKQADTVISSIPTFSLQASFHNGMLKYGSLPKAVDNINFNIQASCPDSNYAHALFAIKNINANVLNNYIKGYFNLSNGASPLVDASLEGILHLEDVKQFYPLDSTSLAGDLHFNIVTKGSYLPVKRLFPVTTATLIMNNGIVHTKYYPSPLEKINIDASITNTTGTFKSLAVNLKPVSFEFEGQAFVLKADLNNFDNLRYDINSNGSIDLGKIYKVFAQQGYDVKGLIKTNLSLRGTQSDAMAGRYNKLYNKGTLIVKDITLSSELFPLPFYISNGVFRFDQDKMWFDQFNAHYGKSAIRLDGYLSNVIGYAMQKDQVLHGNFDLKSDYILVDELMVYGGNTSPEASANTSASSSHSGVVMVPANLSLTLNANATRILFNGININDFHGQLVIDSNYLQLNKTGFTLIGAPVEMDARYTSLSPKKASFDYRISAQEFDIQRAYKEIKIFHDMATSAGSASGIVGLEYHLSGRLDENMNPVYPSLKGEGVLSVKKVKMKGFRLFNAVSSATGKEDVRDPDLSKINIKSKINNNIITVERTKMRVAGFRPRFEGQVSFDGRLNLKGRLGLPPFGILGIPFSVTGTQSNPKVKLKRGSEQDKLEETEDADDGEGEKK